MYGVSVLCCECVMCLVGVCLWYECALSVCVVCVCVNGMSEYVSVSACVHVCLRECMCGVCMCGMSIPCTHMLRGGVSPALSITLF